MPPACFLPLLSAMPCLSAGAWLFIARKKPGRETPVRAVGPGYFSSSVPQAMFLPVALSNRIAVLEKSNFTGQSTG